MEREVKRLEEYRRLRKEIRSSQDYLVVGIDISKDIHNAFMRTPTGQTLYRRLTFHNSREGFDTLLLQVEAMREGRTSGTLLTSWTNVSSITLKTLKSIFRVGALSR